MIRLYRFLRPYRTAIAVILVLVLLQSLANLYLPTLMADIVDNGIVHKDIAYILRIGGLMLLIAAGGMVCAIAASFLSSQTAVGFGRIVRGKLFARVESFSLHEFDTLRHRHADHPHHQRHDPGAAWCTVMILQHDDHARR